MNKEELALEYADKIAKRISYRYRVEADEVRSIAYLQAYDRLCSIEKRGAKLCSFLLYRYLYRHVQRELIKDSRLVSTPLTRDAALISNDEALSDVRDRADYMSEVEYSIDGYRCKLNEEDVDKYEHIGKILQEVRYIKERQIQIFIDYVFNEMDIKSLEKKYKLKKTSIYDDINEIKRYVRDSWNEEYSDYSIS